ncbi:MAG: type II toxin-antitoxin system VapC family toxin [Gemmatimonadaceae bacterium]
MILVDTSVWVDHLRHGDTHLAALLTSEQVAVHPFVIGELACGSLRPHSEVLALLHHLTPATTLTHDDVMRFIAAHRLGGRGIGYVDVHVLASAALDGSALWTRDKALHAVAARLHLTYDA